MMKTHQNDTAHMMTVSQLIDELQKMDPNRFVVMSCDGEGNSYSPLYATYDAMYSPENTWSGSVGLEKLTEENIKLGYSDEDVIEDGIPVVVLVPTN